MPALATSYARWARVIVPVIALALLLGSAGLLYGERATITLSVVPTRVQVDGVVLNAGSVGPNLSTTQLTATVSESEKVTSTVVNLPATIAGGSVTFWCSPMTSCPNGYTVAAGTIIESTGGAKYRTLSAASFPSCAPSSPVGVTALSAGASANAGADSLVYGDVPGYIHVINASAISGGSDPRTVPVVEQADVNAAVQALTSKVTPELPARLQAEAAGLEYLTLGAPTIKASSDTRVGANSPNFVVTVTGTLLGLAFSAHSASDLMRHALSHKVPAGYHLSGGTISPDYAVRQSPASTGEEVTGSAVGYITPNVDARAIAAQLRGQSVSSASHSLGQTVPASSVKIEMTPFAMPWLPEITDHISVVVVDQTAS